MGLLATMASASAKAGAIQREVRGRSVVKAGKWIISDEDMGDIIGILKSLEDSGVLIHCFSKAVKYEIIKQEGEFLGILLGILGASMLGNMLTGRCVVRAGKDVISAGKG